MRGSYCGNVVATIVTMVMTMVAMGFLSDASNASQPLRSASFDSDWQFHLGDAPGAEGPGFDASAWRRLDVPHDWSIEGPAGADPATMDGPFDRRSPGGTSSGSLNGGIGWYRKTFSLPDTARGQRVFVQFDGVYMDSDVWINGHHLGNHPYGYTSFQYDLTPFVKFGAADNVLAVRVNVKQPCSRWYSGAGIYRHVWLTVLDPVHIDHWGTYVTTPKVSDREATIRLRTRVRNDGASAATVSLATMIVGPGGRKVASGDATHEIAAGADYDFDQNLNVTDVRRWSPDDPALYRAVSAIRVDGHPTDAYATPFGIRTFRFTADQGYFLNDKHVVIQGVCNHHDLGCLGAAVNRRGVQRQLELLKAMGCNAIRTSHNPPAPELLDLCDQMGFLVMDEAFDEWKKDKTRYGYGRFFDAWSEPDLVSMVRRDRNHPSIILWSIGNEIPEQNSPNGYEMSKRLADICRREDPTRPVTSACNSPTSAVKNGFVKPLDVFGINYFTNEYDKQRGKVMIASETTSAVSTRGEYNLVLGKDGKPEIKRELNHQCTSYDLASPEWGCTAETSLQKLKDSPWVAGEFVWTGFDYLGEPTPFGWPSRSSYFGILDLCGFPKDRYYVYQSQWTAKPMVHLLPHWNWEGFEGKNIPVWCFSNAESVELFLNGRSLGEKKSADRKGLHFEWSVPYAPGVLKCVAKRGGQPVAVAETHTAGKPARLVLAPDRTSIQANGQDLSFVEVRVVDQDGNLCPNADNSVHFTIQGAGRIAGVDNGDATNHESFQGSMHRVFHGLGLVVIRSAVQPGEIRIEAAADGLPPATAAVSAQ